MNKLPRLPRYTSRVTSVVIVAEIKAQGTHKLGSGAWNSARWQATRSRRD